MNIRKDDIVQVLSGKDRQVRGRVLSVDPTDGTVIVEGVNTIMKHVPRSQRNPQGGRLKKEAAVDACKVQVVCPSCSKPTRVGKRVDKDGAKVRFCKKCDATISVLTPAKKK